MARKVKMKTSTGPHLVIDSSVYIGEPLEDIGDTTGIQVGSSLSTAITAGTYSVATSPL